MEKINEKVFDGERSLFMSRDLEICNTVFAGGESPLKESRNIRIYDSGFKWKYPLWYCNDIDVKNCVLFENARAGIWYTDRINVENTLIEAPKSFRRAKVITLKNVDFPNASETLWNCSDILMEHVTAKGDYFAMNCENMNICDFRLAGNYSFDGAKNISICDSKLISKDAFWNSENVTVKNSVISGEYLGWNARNLTLENCTIESLQGMCYIENLTMCGCRLINTTLAFEYSTVDADICSGIDSVINPSGGIIRAEHIGELILEKDKTDLGKTKIIVKDK